MATCLAKDGVQASRVLIAALLLCAGSVARAQPVAPPSSPPGQPPVATTEATGRDFAGLLLEMPTQQGGLTITCRTAWSWVEEPPLAPSPAGPADRTRQTVGAPVQRMFLRKDVRVQVGSRRLSAARAVVWVERIDDNGGEADERSLYQVAVYFDRVSDPSAAAGGAGGAGGAGDRLLMTARVRGRVVLAADAPPRGERPTLGAPEDLVSEGEARLARYLTQLEDPTPEPAAAPAPVREDPNFAKTHYLPSLNKPYQPGSGYGPNGPRSPLVKVKDAPGIGGSGDQRLFSGRGVLTVAAGQPVLQMGEGEGAQGENRLVVTGGVVLQYSEPARERGLQLSAQNAVVFLKPGKLQDVMRAPADAVVGIYLEGDVVATDNRFTLRAPYVYYDVAANQAYTVDAVFSTFDDRRGLPLYVRAESIRQTTRSSVTATGVKIAASSFFDPLLTLGASSVTLSREPAPDSAGGSRVMVSGKNFVPAIGGLPFMWVPGYSGDIERFPLKDVRLENSSETGFGVQTRWDMFGLTGLRPPEGANLDVDLLLDWWYKRGVAIGGDARWKEDGNRGSLFGYWVPDDNGKDVLASGVKVKQSDASRGMGLYEQMVEFDSGWQLAAQASYISDENFIQSYHDQWAQTHSEFTTSGDLRYTSANAAFSFMGQGNLNDFSPNQFIIQDQGYSGEKLPEATYTRIADDLMAESDPGKLLWTHEYRVGVISQNYFKTTPNQIGYPAPLSPINQFTVGYGPHAAPVGVNQTFEQAALAAGYTEDDVLRADTRQMLEYNMNAGPVKIQPYAVGRVSYYSNDFAALNPSGDGEDFRWWGGGGVRASTQAQRVYEGAESSLLDIHKVRHIIEPNATVFSAGTNRQNTTMPIYDWSVEGGESGTGWRLGLNQTFQTLRGRVAGGPGQDSKGDLASGRSVDLLRWNVDYVNTTSDTNVNGALGKWFDYRPEESIFGHYVNNEVMLLLTDSTSLVSGTTYDFNIDQPSRSSVGLLTDHGRDLRTFVEMRYVNVLDSTYVTFGGDFRLSPLYTMAVAAAYDTDNNEFQDVAFRLNREFPDMTVSVKVRYNNITGETSLGMVFTPLGRNRRLEGMRRLGHDQYLDTLLDAPAATDAAPQ